MGGGDIKLIGALGFVLGLKMVFLNIFLSFIIGAIISLMLIALKKKGRKDSIPFGPFICMGFLITSLWGDKLLLWYINIFWGNN
jgi:leader peptidase (prepilin peptidase)/N-methyltransferase